VALTRRTALRSAANILLPHEQKPNPYIDKCIDFHLLFVRKVNASQVFLRVCDDAGGFGTLDEMFEAATLTKPAKWGHFRSSASERSSGKKLTHLMKHLVTAEAVSQKELDFPPVHRLPKEAVELITGALPKVVSECLIPHTNKGESVMSKLIDIALAFCFGFTCLCCHERGQPDRSQIRLDLGNSRMQNRPNSRYRQYQFR